MNSTAMNQNGVQKSIEKVSERSMPHDAGIIMAIMEALRIHNYEPIVINQLLEYIHRHVSCVIDEAIALAKHANRKFIETDDVKMGAYMTLEKSFTPAPPKDALLELARSRLNLAIPPYKFNCGLLLPPQQQPKEYNSYKRRAAYQPKMMSRSALDRINRNSPLDFNPSLARQNVSRLTTIKKVNRIVVPKPNLFGKCPPLSDEEDFGNDEGDLQHKASNNKSAEVDQREAKQVHQKTNASQATAADDGSTQNAKPESQLAATQEMPSTSKGTNNGMPYMENKRMRYQYPNDSDDYDST